MLIGILIGGMIAMILGVPVLPVLVVGAVVQGLLAYGVTKNRLIISNLIGLCMVAVSFYVLIPLLTNNSQELQSMVEIVNAVAPWAVGTASFLLIGHATFVGVFDIGTSSESKK